QFRFNQSKFYIFFILLFVIRRELFFEKEGLEKDLRFFLINYSVIVFAIGMAPYFIFFLMIYIFYKIPLKNLFKNENIKKYIIVIGVFFIENFLFIIFPNYFIQLWTGFNHPQVEREKIKLKLMRQLLDVPKNTVISYITFLSIIILSIFSFILIIKKSLRIEEKFGYFSLAYIIFGAFSYSIYLYLMLFSLVLLLFVPHLNQKFTGISFVKQNLFFFIGLGSIFFILLFPVDILEPNIFILLDNVIILIFLIIMIISLIRIKTTKYNNN
ncbi:MAG: hypothetical protein ACFFAO_16930, partial [Candidatus Hermodarchaeota archaeon]